MAMNPRKMAIGLGLLSPGGFRASLQGAGTNLLAAQEQERAQAMQNERMGLLRGQDNRAQQMHDLGISQRSQEAALLRRQQEASDQMRAHLILNPNDYKGAINNATQMPVDRRLELLGKVNGLTPEVKATSAIGKIQSDLKAGLIDDATAKAAIAKATAMPVPAVSVTVGNNDTVKNSRDAYKDYRNDPQTQGFQDLRNSYSRIKTAINRESGTGDIAAVVALNKMLDPGSVVRESEVAMQMETSGALDKMRSYAKRMIKGEKLTPAQRQEMMGFTTQLMQGMESRQMEFHKTTRERAEAWGMRPELVAPDLPKIDYGSYGVPPAIDAGGGSDVDYTKMTTDELKAIVNGGR